MQIVSVSQALAAQQTVWVLFFYRVLDAALTSLHCACSLVHPTPTEELHFTPVRGVRMCVHRLRDSARPTSLQT
jgi:hypothetical protein